MKRRLSPILATVLALSLALTGCGGGGSNSSSTPSSSQSSSFPVKESYTFSETMVWVPSRSTEIPATILVPEGEEGQNFPLVVLNHGHGGNRQDLAPLARSLGEKGIASIRMDFAGTGDSEDPFTQNSMFNLITDSNASLNYALENAPIDPERLGIFGYSMGGRVALDIATGPENRYQAVSLLAPFAENGLDMMVKFFGGQAQYDAHYAEALSEKGYTEFTDQFGVTLELSLLWFEDIKASAPLEKMDRFTGDLLVIYGTEDKVVAPEVSKAVVEAAKGTARSVETLEVPGADHGYGFYIEDSTEQYEVRDRVLAATTDFFIKTLIGSTGK